MRVAHGHHQRRMPQDPLQREDVTAIHHVVASERMA